MFYNYIHTKPNGDVFYIGKGKNKRAWVFCDRNPHWQKVVNKYGDPNVKVIAKWENEDNSMLFEKFLIASAKYFKFNLTNKTEGGDGTSGLKRKDVSNYNKTRVNPLKGISGALSKTSMPLCVEFINGDVIYTEVGAQEFARQIGAPVGTISYYLSTGKSCLKYGILKVWRP